MSSSRALVVVAVVSVIFGGLLLGPSLVGAQVGADCHADRLTPRHFLSLRHLMGKWFLHEFASSDRNFDSVDPGADFRCSTVHYEPATPTDLRERIGRFVGTETYKNSSAKPNKHSFKMPVTVRDNRNVVNAIWNASTANGPATMMVLGVDSKYSSWHLMYSCSLTPPAPSAESATAAPAKQPYRWETVAIWGRGRALSPELRSTLKAMLVGLGFPLRSHKAHAQVDCE